MIVEMSEIEVKSVEMDDSRGLSVIRSISWLRSRILFVGGVAALAVGCVFGADPGFLSLVRWHRILGPDGSLKDIDKC